MTARRPDADAVLSLFDEGVAAIEKQAEQVDWDRAACGSWTAAEVARHVAGVIGWYDEWLDRAAAGDAEPPFAASDLARRNDEAVHARADQVPADAITEFVDSANLYAARLREHWDLPYGYPFGTVTAGLHAAAAASEWHLHAWDLAGATDADHRPSQPDVLFRAVGRCVTTARGGPVGAMQGALVRAGASIRPWEQMLRASGRRARRS